DSKVNGKLRILINPNINYSEDSLIISANAVFT
ncbi:MAG: hypothetical protein ACI86X_001196, partial [Moritella sp.]